MLTLIFCFSAHAQHQHQKILCPNCKVELTEKNIVFLAAEGVISLPQVPGETPQVLIIRTMTAFCQNCMANPQLLNEKVIEQNLKKSGSRPEFIIVTISGIKQYKKDKFQREKKRKKKPAPFRPQKGQQMV